MTRRIPPLSERDLLRARSDVWGAGLGMGNSAVILAGRPARYMRVPASTASALEHLAGQPLGVAVCQIRSRWPEVDFDSLARRLVVDVIPAEGIRPRARVVAELWLRNICSRFAIACGGWPIVARAMSSQLAPIPVARPLYFDEIEAAARCSFAFPLTSRRCTVVAVAIYRALRARDASARVEVIAEPQGVFMHSYAAVGHHIIDPGDSILEGSLLRQIGQAD